MNSSIKDILVALLNIAEMPFEGVSEASIAGQRVFRVESADGRELIGIRGETIRALDHLVRKIAERQGIEDLQFLVDVNGYRVKQIEDLQMKARMMAERARSFQYDVELTPMSAYERLIIHTTLADMEDITTESHGDGRTRRVIIRYRAVAPAALDEVPLSE